MDNNIELFDRYIAHTLSQEETEAFDRRLKTDSDFALDFKAYLMVARGVCQEAEQDNFEFGHAMKKISKDELLKIIGRKKTRKAFRFTIRTERLAWAATIVLLATVGLSTIFDFRQSSNYEIDNLVCEYNYITPTNRSADDTAIDIANCDAAELEAALPELKRLYEEAPEDDTQAQQDAGMRLAMAYLKLHDRKMTRQTLEELKTRFADDEMFVAQCNRILSEIK